MTATSHDDLVAPVGIATKAALFLNEIAPPPAGGPGDDALTGALRGVGLDPALVATVIDAVAAGGGLEMGLVEALADPDGGAGRARAPGQPARGGGGRGPGPPPGAALADEMGIDPARIPLASLDAGAYALATGPLLLRSAEDAAERAPGWRRSEAAVVVVDAGVTEPGAVVGRPPDRRPASHRRVGSGRLHLQDRGHRRLGRGPRRSRRPGPREHSTPP